MQGRISLRIDCNETKFCPTLILSIKFVFTDKVDKAPTIIIPTIGVASISLSITPEFFSLSKYPIPSLYPLLIP